MLRVTRCTPVLASRCAELRHIDKQRLARPGSRGGFARSPWLWQSCWIAAMRFLPMNLRRGCNQIVVDRRNGRGGVAAAA